LLGRRCRAAPSIDPSASATASATATASAPQPAATTRQPATTDNRRAPVQHVRCVRLIKQQFQTTLCGYGSAGNGRLDTLTRKMRPVGDETPELGQVTDHPENCVTADDVPMDNKILSYIDT